MKNYTLVLGLDDINTPDEIQQTKEDFKNEILLWADEHDVCVLFSDDEFVDYDMNITKSCLVCSVDITKRKMFENDLRWLLNHAELK